MPADNAGQQELISIVIPCRNEAGCIAQVLDSILAQETAGMLWEVIVADGMSDDGTRAVLDSYQRLDSRIRVIDNPAQAVSSGLNLAIREARGEIILRMDAHTDYAPDYVRRCTDTLREKAADNVGGPARTRPNGYWGRAIAAAYHSPVACGGARFHNPTFEGWVDTVPYGCWRKSTLLEIGLFDEALVRNQDDELNLRLCRAGGRIWQSPDIVSWYQPRHSLNRLFMQYFQYGFWKVAVIRKHHLPASWRHLVPAAFVGFHVLMFLAALVALLGGAKPAETVLLTAWAIAIAAYVLACAAASVQSAHKAGWSLLPVLPLVFFTYHFSYGAGFLSSLLYPATGDASRGAPKAIFTRVSR
jgi:succinoglycan biosynthesis protein ExoA